MQNRTLWAFAAVVCLAVLAFAAEKKTAAPLPGSSYLFVWAGDDARKASDFLAVVDANPSSPRYGRIVASVPVGDTGTMPHHTEYEYPAGNMLFANGWAAGHNFLFDLSRPLHPRVAKKFNSVDGYSFAHSFVRLPNGHVLATFQSRGAGHAPGGGLIELDQQGTRVRTSPAMDPSVEMSQIWPYSLDVDGKLGVAVTSNSPMPLPDWAEPPSGSWSNEKADANPSTTVQVWRLSDLKMVKTVPLPADAGKHNSFPAEPRLLPDGTMYVNTFTCGLFRMRGLDTDHPAAEQVYTFPGFTGTMETMCMVPVVVGRYWVQTLPSLPGLIVLDISHPEKPVEVSRLKIDGERYPMVHWISADRKGDRLVLTGAQQSWLLIAHLDSSTGKVTLDDSFHAPGSSVSGIRFEGAALPHGGKALVHGSLFGQ